MSAGVTLTSNNMGGNATSPDFDAWIEYVRAHLAETIGEPSDFVSVDSFPFGNGPAQDDVRGSATARDTVREALHSLWDSFCAEGAVQP
jgi:hypothetical protein